jgi:hypothetical protein
MRTFKTSDRETLLEHEKELGRITMILSAGEYELQELTDYADDIQDIAEALAVWQTEAYDEPNERLEEALGYVDDVLVCLELAMSSLRLALPDIEHAVSELEGACENLTDACRA